MCKKLLFFILLIFSFQTNFFAQKGKLASGKESLKTTNSYKGKKNVKVSTSQRTSVDDGEMNLFVRILWYAVGYTVYGVTVESPWELKGRMHDAEIAHYPYKEFNNGNFIYTDSTNYNITRFDITNNFLLENSHLYGNNFGVNFRFFKRFALDLEYLYFTEKVNGKRDSFSLYSGLLKYHRIRTQKLDAWFGLGVMHVANEVNTSGFALGVGAEWFVTKPISIDFSYKWGYINDNTVNKTKALLKYYLKNYHISSGYEHFKIGVSKINAFSIGIGASF